MGTTTPTLPGEATSSKTTTAPRTTPWSGVDVNDLPEVVSKKTKVKRKLLGALEAIKPKSKPDAEPESEPEDGRSVKEKIADAAKGAAGKIKGAAGTVKDAAVSAAHTVKEKATDILSLEDIPLPELTAEQQEQFRNECWAMFKGCKLKMRMLQGLPRAMTAFGAYTTRKGWRNLDKEVNKPTPVRNPLATATTQHNSPSMELTVEDVEGKSDNDLLAEAIQEQHPDVDAAELDKFDATAPDLMSEKAGKSSLPATKSIDSLPSPPASSGIPRKEFIEFVKMLYDYMPNALAKQVGWFLADIGISLPLFKVLTSSVMLAKSSITIGLLKHQDRKIHHLAKEIDREAGEEVAEHAGASGNLIAKFGAAGMDLMMRRKLKLEYAGGATRVADFTTALVDPTTLVALAEGATTATIRLVQRLTRMALAFYTMVRTEKILQSSSEDPPPGFFPDLMVNCPLLMVHYFYRQKYPEDSPEWKLQQLARKRLRGGDLMLVERNGTVDEEAYDPGIRMQLKELGTTMKNLGHTVAEGAKSAAKGAKELAHSAGEGAKNLAHGAGEAGDRLAKKVDAASDAAGQKISRSVEGAIGSSCAVAQSAADSFQLRWMNRVVAIRPTA